MAEATEGLRAALEAHGLDYIVDEGGGAFYGPKIDVDVKDAIGRAWQLSTIQLDFNLPERFDLEYVASDGERKRPVMIHRALMGSVERFFGVLIEHYAGALPAWLAPTQVRVLPVAEVHDDYAHDVAARLRVAGFRVDVVSAVEPLGKRVRNGKVEKVPYVLVVGDDDVANDTVGVNKRGQDKPERNVDRRRLHRPPGRRGRAAKSSESWSLWAGWRNAYVRGVTDDDGDAREVSDEGQTLFEAILHADVPDETP